MHPKRSINRSIPIVAITACALFVASACSPDGPASGSAAAESSTESMPSSGTTTSLDAVTSAPSKPSNAEPEGIIVTYTDKTRDGAVVVGQINPKTGEYEDYRVFEIPNGVTPGGIIEPEYHALSEDYSRLAATKSVNGQTHAGWIDDSGTFVDVNEGEIGSDFDGGRGYAGRGFDHSGAFYYGENADGRGVDDATYKLAPQETDSSKAVMLPQRKPYDEPNSDPVLNWFTGEIVWMDEADWCQTDIHQRVTLDSYLYADDTQLYLMPYGYQSTAVECTSDTGIPLLPETNTNEVSEPVMSEAGTEVAFKLRDGQGYTKLYTVTADGRGTPMLIPAITGINLQNVILYDWK